LSNRLAIMFYEDPVQGVQDILLLSFFPYVYHVLALYILFLAATPAMLWLSNRVGRVEMMLVSFATYCAVQAFPVVVRLPDPLASNPPQNPFAWQVLFFAGVAIGSRRPPSATWLSRGRILIALTVAGLTGAFLWKISSLHPILSG